MNKMRFACKNGDLPPMPVPNRPFFHGQHSGLFSATGIREFLIQIQQAALNVEVTGFRPSHALQNAPEPRENSRKATGIVLMRNSNRKLHLINSKITAAIHED